MSTLEGFLLVPDHTAYRVSRDGTFQSCLRRIGKNLIARTDRWKTLRGCVNSDGYRVYVLNRDGGGKTYFYLHVMVMRTFVGPCPEGMEVCHRDDDKLNNRLDNLYYGTRQQNVDDKVRNGNQNRGASHGASKLTEAQVRDIRSRPRTSGYQTRMASEFGVGIACINGIIKGRSWKHVT